jgi:hypothetical protein
VTVDTRNRESGASLPTVAQSMAAVRFRGDPTDIRSLLLPDPLEPHDDGNVGWIAIVDTIMPRARRENPELPPRATAFKEVAVGTPCQWEGETYLANPYIYVDRSTAGFERGIIQGIADVAKETWHPTCRGRAAPAAGQTVRASASYHGESIVDLAMELGDSAPPSALPGYFFDYVHYRRLPDATSPGEYLAHDLAAMETTDFEVGAVREAEAECRWGHWLDGRFAALDVELGPAYHVTFAYEYVEDRFLTPVASGGGIPG